MWSDSKPPNMVECEMCGTETGSPTTAKIEGAELQVCDACVDFGTAIQSDQSESTSSKYSTSSTGSSGGGTNASTTPTTSAGSSGGRRQRDLFDEMEVLADDYPARIREAREDEGLSQEELAEQLNEKASLIRKLERGDMQPNDSIQRKLERKLDISLTESSGTDDSDWENDISPSTTTLGDVVKRGE